MSRLRRSSALILTRGRGDELEVYLVERAPELPFFGGYWALPGGVVDGLDRRTGDDEDHEAALERAALRELFEETGVWLGDADAWDGESRRAARRDLLRREPVGDLWEARAAEVDQATAALRRVCEITTPPFAPVRHRTPFFHAELPAQESPEVLLGELVQGRFWKPAEVIAAWTRGEALIVPPVLYLMRRMADGLDSFFELAERDTRALAAGRLHEVTFSPGVFMAALETETLPPATTTNTILVGDRRVYVVDPATRDPREQARLFETLDAWRADGRVLEGVLLTHHHSDHVGALREVCARYDLRVLAHRETLARVDVAGLSVRELNDGDVLELGAAPDGRADWKLHVLHTPGHAPGHLVFLEDRYGAGIVGDMASTLSTIVIDPPEGHMATYLDSLARLRDRGIGMLYPAHGPAHRDGTALLGALIEHRLAREARLRAALRVEARREDELLGEVYDDVADERLLPVAARSLRAGLEKLAEEGIARLSELGWRLA
ncbi:MAG: MBL fold metallo-hydrolase [Planctomycetes bacterium]|nr:MBL fold metallo-hydrolase [Planctomycetota bacterium]MCB9904650.1 MBL fold metallo-hydrolase [Planctomycetota bacterium]